MAKRTIPQVRDRLREIADELGVEELHELADDMHRNTAVSRAARRSATLTSKLASDIRAFKKKNPKLHQRDIAQKFNVNPGRVSEALNNQK